MSTLPRILVVDDEESVAFTLAANLEMEGFEVETASNGLEALEYLADNPVDIVLSDVLMPGMTGVEMLMEARRRGLEMPIVLMTAFTKEQFKREAITAGVFAVLNKPFDIDFVVGLIRRAVCRPNVLVVDDHEGHAMSAGEMLNVASVSAEYVTSAREALERLAAGGIDLCLTDLVMPDTDGAELCARIREQHHAVLVFVITGHDVPELMRRATQEGATAILRKPYSDTQLLGMIAGIRGSAAYARRPVPAPAPAPSP